MNASHGVPTPKWPASVYVEGIEPQIDQAACDEVNVIM